MLVRLCLIAYVLSSITDGRLLKPLLSSNLAREINAGQTTWRATPSSKFLSWSEEAIRRLMGVHPDYSQHLQELDVLTHEVPNDLPENFDSREQWPNCPTLKEVRDQGRFVFIASLTRTDHQCSSFQLWQLLGFRRCRSDVRSDLHRVQRGSECSHLSRGSRLYVLELDLLANQDGCTSHRLPLACCKSCGFGCNGGFPSGAWSYFKKTGLVTGGNYDTNEGCEPYSIPSCDHQ